MNSVSQSRWNEAPNRNAADQLGALHQLGRSANKQASAVWFPLIVGGIFTLASPTAIDLIGGKSAPAWYWGFAGPAIGILCGIFYGHRPVQMPARRGIATASISAAMIVISFTAGLIAGDSSGATLPVTIVATGWGLFAWLYRSLHVAAAALATAAGALLLAINGSTDTERIVSLVSGAISCFAGLHAVLAEESHLPVSL